MVSAAFHAVVARAEPANRAATTLLMDGFAVVTRAAEAVVARAVKADRATVACFLQSPTGVSALSGNAVATGAVVADRTPSEFRQGAYRLLRQRGGGRGHHEQDREEGIHDGRSE